MDPDEFEIRVSGFGEVPSTMDTVWSEGFLYKVAPPELEISPSMYVPIYNLVV